MSDITKNQPAGATEDYSATKAPENRKHVTSTETTSDPKLKPGGRNGVRADVGMSGLPDEKPLGTVDDTDLDQSGTSQHERRDMDNR